MNIKLLTGEEIQGSSLHSVIRYIIRISNPEKILLLSASYTYLFTENIFQKKPLLQIQGNRYELMILSSVHDKTELTALGQKLKQSMFHRKFLFTLMDIAEFNKKVEAGDEYLNHILLHAMMSYDNGRIPLAFPGQLSNEESVLP
jgi:hypothetical protein